jgi:hypothetical protein
VAPDIVVPRSPPHAVKASGESNKIKAMASVFRMAVPYPAAQFLIVPGREQSLHARMRDETRQVRRDARRKNPPPRSARGGGRTVSTG